MKPRHLTLQAFGSYRGELSVDFTRLSRHGIFAITGPTGAGKSTIFDAIVYALYGELPGFRKEGNIRSQFADPDVPTVVSLEFEAHGDVWRIERIPPQLATKRRGSGSTTRPARLSLERLGAGVPPLAKKGEVTSLLADLVGLTRDQFEQVVLIPQGRFEAVLKADTGARAPLLRQLFPVDIYRRVTEQLRAAAADCERRYDEAERAETETARRLADAVLSALVKVPAGVELPPLPAGITDDRLTVEALRRYGGDLDRLRRQVSGLAERAGRAAERARVAVDAAERDAERYDRWRDDTALALTFADEERADIPAGLALERSRQLVPVAGAVRGWGPLLQQLEQLEAAHVAARATALHHWIDRYDEAGLDTAQGAALLAQHVARDAQELESALARYRHLVDRHDQVAAQEKQLAGTELELDGQRVAAEQRAARIDALAPELDRLAALTREVEAATSAETELRAERQLAGRRQEAAGRVADHARAEAQLAGLAEAARLQLHSVRTKWQQGVAAHLADSLVDGDPCPTCGATEHPRPAAPAPSAPDQLEWSAAEQAWTDAVAARDGAARELAGAQGELVGMAPTRPLAVLDAALTRLAAQMTAGRGQLSAGRPLAAEHAQLLAAADQGTIPRLEAELAAGRAALAVEVRLLGADRLEFERQHGAFISPGPAASARRRLAAALTRLAEAAQAREAAVAGRQQLLATLAVPLAAAGETDPGALAAFVLHPPEIERRQQGLDARADRRRQVGDRITAYHHAGGPTERPAIEPLQLAAKQAVEDHLDLVERLAVIKEQAELVAAGPAALEAAAAAVTTARRAYEEARTLADRCAGTAAGPGVTRLSLENWVLADYLRQVLVQANARLEVMTGGRYTLRLSDGVTDGRRPWGLDLSVFDVHTGQVRPATTLSGGETFMAALALALGLADVVSGGSNRRIGALFIDEGFGYLDPQALESVIEVLRSLEDGGRIVGVISHMDEITRALPTGISVEPSAAGSVARLHYPST